MSRTGYCYYLWNPETGKDSTASRISSGHSLPLHGVTCNCRARVWFHLRSGYARSAGLAPIVCCFFFFVSHLFAPHAHLPSDIFPSTHHHKVSTNTIPALACSPTSSTPVDGKVGSVCNNNDEELTGFYVVFDCSNKWV